MQQREIEEGGVPETASLEEAEKGLVEKRGGRLGKAEERPVVVVRRRGVKTAVAAMEAETVAI